MKKFFSAILLMTMMVFSVGTFVSCNDLVNEIEDVKGQAGELQTAIAELEGEIASLETALQNAKAEAAAAAKTAADAAAKAQETGDAAAKAAKDAAAVAAAAQASAEAIEAQLADAKAALQAALDGKADKADVEAAVKEIEALKAALAGKADATDVEALKKTVELLQATLEKYQAALDELKLQDKAFQDAYADLEARLQKTLSDMQATDEANAEAVADLKKLVEKLNGNLTGFTQTIKDLVNRIQSVVYVPEYTDGIIRANKYYSGDFDSDYYVKATFEVTPKELAAEITDANVYFNTVDTKAAAAEVVVAKVLSTSAATGRVEVLGYVKDNDANKVAYAELDRGGVENTTVWKDVEKTDSQGNKYWTREYVGYTEKEKSEVAFALNIVNDNASVTLPDSTEVDADVHVSSAYVPVIGIKNSLNSVARTYNTEKNEWVNGLSLDSNGDLYPTEEISVKYTDLETKSPLAKYDLRFDINGFAMTAAEAAAFLGTTIKVEMPDELVEYNVFHKNNAVTLDQENKKNPFSVKLNDFLSTVALVTPSDPKNASLKDYRTSNVTIELPLIDIKGYNWTRKVKVNGYYAYSAYPVAAKVTIDYATSNADIDFGTFDAGSWSYKYWNGGEHRYTNWAIDKEIRLNVPMDLAKLKVCGYYAYDNNGYFSVPVHADSDADGVADKTGYAFFEVLSSNTVELYGLDIPITDKPLTYSTDEEFYYVDPDNIKYTAKFSATVGARPADKEIPLGDLTYTGPININTGVTKIGATKAVAPLAEALKVDGSFYADLLAEKTVYDLVNAGIGTAVQDSKATAALVDVMYAGNPVAETSKIKVDAVSAYGTKYTVKTTIPFYGVEYTFVGSLTVNKPNYAIKNSALLINPSTGIGDIKGKVVYPEKVTGTTQVNSGEFTLDAIDLRNYVVITNDGANATEALLESGEFKLKYELVSTYDKDNDPTTPEVVIPGISYTTTLLDSDLNAANVVTWAKSVAADEKYFSEAKFRVTLVASNGALVKTPYGYVADNFGSTEFTLKIADLVTLQPTAKVATMEFIPGEDQEAVINICKSIIVKDFNGKSLIGKKAETLDNLWDETKGGKQWLMYGQDVKVVRDNNVVPTAVVESTGDALYLNKDFEVLDNGDVKLLATDLNIQSNVVVTVPLKLTHDYQDANDTHVVNVQVKFTPAK